MDWDWHMFEAADNKFFL